jgi:hypothetical protein
MATDSSDKSTPATEQLVDFYASQADVLLAQYKNINQLLGETSDWSHPGTHCEVLIRDFLRRNVPNYMRVDKGYVYGRTERNGETTHCPEIDILIHNIDKLPPVFRLDEFAIVQAAATLAMIQVKRTLDPSTCSKGIVNVVEAKVHFAKMLRETLDFVTLNDLHPLFAAVISIDDKLGESTTFKETVSNQLTDAAKRYPPFPLKRGHRVAVTMLPQFVGSLRGHFAIVPYTRADEQKYDVYMSYHDDRNVALQALYGILSYHIFPFGPKPRFDFPKAMRKVDEFVVKEEGVMDA